MQKTHKCQPSVQKGLHSSTELFLLGFLPEQRALTLLLEEFAKSWQNQNRAKTNGRMGNFSHSIARLCPVNWVCCTVGKMLEFICSKVCRWNLRYYEAQKCDSLSMSCHHFVCCAETFSHWGWMKKDNYWSSFGWPPHKLHTVKKSGHMPHSVFLRDVERPLKSQIW